MTIDTIDTHYLGSERVAAAYLMVEGDEAAFVEVNTSHAWPRLPDALEARGMTPDQVRWIIVTHVHLDHAGGASTVLSHCPHATILAHPRAAPHLIDPTKLVASARQVYGDAFDSMYGPIEPVPAERVRIMDDDEVLTWGTRELTFLHTRGHANHHFCILDSRENTIFTGDSFGIAYPDAQTHGRWIFPTSSPTDFDAKAAIESVRRIVLTGAATARPTHFGVVEDLPSVAAELIEQLERYRVLVDDVDRTAGSEEEVEDRCRRQVSEWFAEELEARGYGDDAAVADLLRMDIDLNAQGLAFAVKKRWFKRSRA